MSNEKYLIYLSYLDISKEEKMLIINHLIELSGQLLRIQND